MVSNNKTEIKSLVALEAQRQGVPVDLALALAKQESGFNPGAKSSAGAIGVMQLMPGTAKELGVNPNNIQENIRGGITYLKRMLDRYNGDYKLALAAYNAGAGAVDKHGGVPPYKETQNYVNKITESITPNQVTGAAAPITQDIQDIGDRLGDIYQGALSDAQQGINQYLSQPYDPSLGLALRQRRQQEYDNALNKVVRETPLGLTPQQQQDILSQFDKTSQDVQNIATQTQDRIQSMTGSNIYAPYEEKLKQAYADQIAALDAANPYTKLSQVAPISTVDQNLINAQNQAYDVANLLARSTGLQEPINYAQRNVERALQARDISAMNATGLTPEEYLAMGKQDYNSRLQALNAQNQELSRLYMMAMSGDQNAMAILANIGQTAQGNITTNQANAFKALQDAKQAQMDMAKFNWERNRQIVEGVQGLDPYMVQGAGDIQKQNISSAGNLYGTGMNAGVDAQGNLVRYETGMQPGIAGNANEIKPITPQQYGSTMLNAAAMSGDPTAFQGAMQNYQNIAAQYGQIDPRLIYGTNNLPYMQ